MSSLEGSGGKDLPVVPLLLGRGMRGREEMSDGLGSLGGRQGKSCCGLGWGEASLGGRGGRSLGELLGRGIEGTTPFWRCSPLFGTEGRGSLLRPPLERAGLDGLELVFPGTTGRGRPFIFPSDALVLALDLLEGRVREMAGLGRSHNDSPVSGL